MKIKELYNLARNNKYYEFENILAEKFFNRPSTEDTSDLTDKLVLSISSLQLKEKEEISFKEWRKNNQIDRLDYDKFLDKDGNVLGLHYISQKYEDYIANL